VLRVRSKPALKISTVDCFTVGIAGQYPHSAAVFQPDQDRGAGGGIRK
jgi:hypothetical protein